ncbi:MAG: hypothetical protein ACRC8S_14885 [Fimbriiglobus sp.]
MSERRPLVEGLKPIAPVVDPALEKQFVFGGVTSKPEPPVIVEKAQPAQSRAPLTTRIRADFATALKRASLERQLSGTTPNTLQEILEEALEPWLKTHGYVP